MIQKFQTTANKLTNTQKVVIGAITVSAAPAGPIVAALAAIGAVGGCLLSNAIGGCEIDSGPASHS